GRIGCVAVRAIRTDAQYTMLTRYLRGRACHYGERVPPKVDGTDDQAFRVSIDCLIDEVAFCEIGDGEVFDFDEALSADFKAPGDAHAKANPRVFHQRCPVLAFCKVSQHYRAASTGQTEQVQINDPIVY